MALTFSIPDWKAWYPTHNDVQPDVSVIPAMLRRRLSPVGRAALSVLLPLADHYGAMPLVYVSRHGDLTRTLGLLEDLARNEPLSPAAFSLSVHNATAGLFSIHRGLTKNITAISGGNEELVPALLESLGLCHNEDQQVLCVFCDETPPPIYRDQTSQPEHPYALALVIGKGEDYRLALASQPDTDAIEHIATPQALRLLDFLGNSTGSMVVVNNGSAWQLSRCAS